MESIRSDPSCWYGRASDLSGLQVGSGVLRVRLRGSENRVVLDANRSGEPLWKLTDAHVRAAGRPAGDRRSRRRRPARESVRVHVESRVGRAVRRAAWVKDSPATSTIEGDHAWSPSVVRSVIEQTETAPT
jgi:hypothetical protein